MDGFGGNDMIPAYYAMGAALVGAIAVACMKETAQQPLEGSPPAVATKEEAVEMVTSQSPDPRF